MMCVPKQGADRPHFDSCATTCSLVAWTSQLLLHIWGSSQAIPEQQAMPISLTHVHRLCYPLCDSFWLCLCIRFFYLLLIFYWLLWESGDAKQDVLLRNMHCRLLLWGGISKHPFSICSSVSTPHHYQNQWIKRSTALVTPPSATQSTKGETWGYFHQNAEGCYSCNKNCIY